MRSFAVTFLVLTLGMAGTTLFAQGKRAKPAAKARTIVFAVLSDGKTLEPIGYVSKGKIEHAVDNSAEGAQLAAFNRSYYKPAATYRLIFGGADAGTVTVKSSDPKAECIQSMATVTVTSPKARLKGNVMAVATNMPTGKAGSGLRRLPTAEERAEIESLVRSEMEAQKVPPAIAKNLKYHNLTAIDVDSDGTPELVGTFWTVPAAKTRSLLFFIAEKSADGKYAFGFRDFRTIEEKDVMSGSIADVDLGVYHERLLDILDIDGDGTAEVFSYVQSFEGAGFNVYHRTGGKWSNIYEGANYHCGY